MNCGERNKILNVQIAAQLKDVVREVQELKDTGAGEGGEGWGGAPPCGAGAAEIGVEGVGSALEEGLRISEGDSRAEVAGEGTEGSEVDLDFEAESASPQEVGLALLLRFFPVGGQTEKSYTSEKRKTHRLRPSQSAYRGWSVPTKKCW